MQEEVASLCYKFYLTSITLEQPKCDLCKPTQMMGYRYFAAHDTLRSTRPIPWSAVTKAVKDYELFPERGIWKDGWRTVKVAIDERGRATFYDLFHTHTKFKHCDECPHKWW